MRRTIIVSFIMAALLGGQNLVAAQIGSTFFRSIAAIPSVQLKTGSISGVITDPSSSAAADATVTAVRDTEGASTLKSFSTVTDSKGCFSFAALPVGTYDIHVGWFEMGPLIKEVLKRVIVRRSENMTVEIRLQFIEDCAGNPLTQSLSDSDRAEIVKWMIEEAITKKKVPSDSTISSDKSVVLSTANIDSTWVPIIPGHKFILLTPAEVQKKANRQGDYMYWQFDKIRARGSCVVVSLSNLWADGTSSIETGKRTLLGESLFNYVFRKQSGKWIGKFMSGSIS